VNKVFNGSKVLVTGHTGFKGSWLSLWLAQLGADVHGVSLSIPTSPSNFETSSLSEYINDHRLDICDGSSFNSLVKDIKPDFFFHLAAQPLVRLSYAEPALTWQTNAIGTVNALNSLRDLENPCVAVFITSDKCYDNVEWAWGYRETDALGGPDPYSASKGAAELAIKSFVQSYFKRDGVIRVGVGRAGNVIGGGDWAADRIVPDCMRAWGKSEVLQLRNPHATRPWQHVLEPLSGYLTLASSLCGGSQLHGEAFNFGPLAQQNYSVADLISKMAESWNKVRWVDSSEGKSGPHESGLLKLNCDKALHYLNWHAVWDFEETVKETVGWYKNFYQNPSLSTHQFTLQQILSYSASAKKQGMKWRL